MVEIADVVDRESLEAWLTAWAEGRSDEDARRDLVTVGFRSALRALPAHWNWSLGGSARRRNLTALPILRCNLITGAAALNPTPKLTSATRAANAAARAAYSAAAAVSAAYAANAAASYDAAAGSAYAAYATAAAATATAYAGPIWAEVRADLGRLEAADDQMGEPIWEAVDDPLADAWAKVQDTLSTDPDGPWQFWLDWYTNAREGRHLPLDLWEQIALIENAIWEAGPEAVATAIREILANFAEGKLSRGEQFQYDEKRAIFAKTAVAAEQTEKLHYCVSRLREIDALAQRFDNIAGAIHAELFLIRRATEHHADNPVMVWNNARTAHQMLEANIGSGAVPTVEQDPFLGMLETALLEVQSALAQEEAVRSVSSDGPTEIDVSDAAEQELLEHAAFEVSAYLEPDVAEETRDAARILQAPRQSLPMRVWAGTLVAGRVMAVWLAARYAGFKWALDEAAGLSEKMKVVAVNSAKIGAVTAGPVLAILNSEKVAAAVQVLLRAWS